MIFYIYEVPGEKNGATKHWDQRRQYNFNLYQIEPVIIETYDMPNNEDTWQFIGDREWELADQNGYPRGVHYKTTVLRGMRAANTNMRSGQFLEYCAAGGRANKGGKNPSLGIVNKAKRVLTYEDAQKIRELYKNKVYGLSKQIMEEYDIGKAVFYGIVNNKYYLTP
jgi:hypothetical protein